MLAGCGQQLVGLRENVEVRFLQAVCVYVCVCVCVFV